MGVALDIDTGYERVISRRVVESVERLLYGLEHPGGSTSLTLAKSPSPTLTSLRGLGAEIWAGVDVEEYVRRLRDEWA